MVTGCLLLPLAHTSCLHRAENTIVPRCRVHERCGRLRGGWAVWRARGAAMVVAVRLGGGAARSTARPIRRNWRRGARIDSKHGDNGRPGPNDFRVHMLTEMDHLSLLHARAAAGQVRERSDTEALSRCGGGRRGLLVSPGAVPPARRASQKITAWDDHSAESTTEASLSRGGARSRKKSRDTPRACSRPRVVAGRACFLGTSSSLDRPARAWTPGTLAH